MTPTEIDRIVFAAARMVGLTSSDVLDQRDQSQQAIYGRELVYAVLRRRHGMSYAEAGRAVQCHRATVFKAFRRFSAREESPGGRSIEADFIALEKALSELSERDKNYCRLGRVGWKRSAAAAC